MPKIMKTEDKQNAEVVQAITKKKQSVRTENHPDRKSRIILFWMSNPFLMSSDV